MILGRVCVVLELVFGRTGRWGCDRPSARPEGGVAQRPFRRENHLSDHRHFHLESPGGAFSHTNRVLLGIQDIFGAVGGGVFPQGLEGSFSMPI